MGSKVTVKCFRYVERCQKIFFHKVRKNPGLGGKLVKITLGPGVKSFNYIPVANELRTPSTTKYMFTVQALGTNLAFIEIMYTNKQTIFM